ncbi:hypothetical protein ACS0TY_031488 [Phlomoides rotata]
MLAATSITSRAPPRQTCSPNLSEHPSVDPGAIAQWVSGSKVHSAMADGSKTRKVATWKPFNALGFLEAMKRAMNPSKGFTATEIGPNLFSFQFQSHADLEEVKWREPWHFKKHIVLLQEIGEGEQPSAVTFKTTSMSVRLYNLPMAARSEKYLISIASRCGEVVEIDKTSTTGFGRSIRVKVNLDITKPLKMGIKILNMDGRHVWIPFKFERLPSFCFLCGLIGHMKRECDFEREKQELLNIPDEKLPYRDWMKTSPLKRASVTTIPSKEKRVTSPLRRWLFEKLKAELNTEETETSDSRCVDNKGEEDGIYELSKDLKRVAVSEERKETGRREKREDPGNFEKEDTKIKEENHTLIQNKSNPTTSINYPTTLTPTAKLFVMCNNSPTNLNNLHPTPSATNYVPPQESTPYATKSHDLLNPHTPPKTI